MITNITGSNIFNSDAEVLVNPVNCVGVMGAGLAAQFKERFPLNYHSYKTACDHKLIYAGKIHIFPNAATTGKMPIYIINFPTKLHWRDPSKIEYIEWGLHNLVSVIERRDIRSIAFPRLGCGLGGLKWSEVEPIMQKHLENLDAEVSIYKKNVRGPFVV